MPKATLAGIAAASRLPTLADARFRRGGFGRPLTVVFPALHQRRDQREEVDGDGWGAGLDDDFAVDFSVHHRRDAAADGVVG